MHSRKDAAGGSAKGFTLIELVTVIVILGVVSVGISSFVRSSVQTYVDVSERDALLSQSRFVVERLNRELRNAIPNSVVVRGNSSAHCLAFVPIADSTFYLDLPMLPGEDVVSVVAMADIDGSVFTLQSNDYAIVYPVNNDDIYNRSRHHSKQISGCTDDDCSASNGVVKLDVAGPFAESSPAQRLYVAREVVRYCATAGNLYRTRFSYNNFNLANLLVTPSNGALMAQGLVNALSSDPQVQHNNSDDPFRVYDATLQRNGFIHLLLRFARGDEVIAFSNEVHIPNVP